MWSLINRGVDIFLDFHKAEGSSKINYRENCNNPEERRIDDLTRWCYAKIGRMADSVPPDKGCEVLHRELAQIMG